MCALAGALERELEAPLTDVDLVLDRLAEIVEHQRSIANLLRMIHDDGCPDPSRHRTFASFAEVAQEPI